MAQDRLEADPLDDGYRIKQFAQQDDVGADDVLAFWEREGVLDADEARRRINEVHLVGIHEHDGVVGVSSTYLRRDPQLDMEFWYYRAYVDDAHRGSNVAVNLAVTGRDVLTEQFVSGRDTRGKGLIYEVEHEGLKRYFSFAFWIPTGLSFIGVNAKGDHVRVRYFPGVHAPGPPR
jgi:hypothetical protein